MTPCRRDGIRDIAIVRRLPDAVDVVVPLAGAHAEVTALAAGLRGGATAYRLVLVDDTTTELRQGAMRKRLAAHAGGPCVWLRAHRKGAMPALAMAAAEGGGGDVALVDPRVRLTPGWLDRLRACMEGDARIGVVGTWSTADRDTQGFMQRLALGGGWRDADVVEEAFGLAAVPVHPEVAIVAGPCVLVRRAVLDAARAAGRLGSLAELCAGAHARGFRVHLADDVVAQHVPYDFDPGEPRSDDGAVGAALLSLGVRDPIAPLRTILGTTLAMLERCDRPGVLHVAHARGGGTERYIRDAIAATRDTHRHYALRIHADRWTLEDARDDVLAAYEWPRDAPAADDGFLRDICSWLRIDLVHVHSLVGSGDDFLRALRAAGVAYLYTAHDMYLPCPSIYLIDAAGRYCNATTDPAACQACLRGMSGLREIDIVAWRARYAGFMHAARRVVAPSQWAAETILAYYPKAPVTVIPHGPGTVPEPVETTADPVIVDLPRDDRRHVGVLGAVGPEKGSRHIDAMAQRIRERQLPLRIVVIGYTDRECRFHSEDGVLSVHGPYERGEVEVLCDAYRIDVMVFPSIWPETFSYTLGEAWAAGRPALVPGRGALGERVAATQAGWIVDPDAGVDEWIDMLMQVTSPAKAAELAEKAQRARAAAAAARAADEPAPALYAELARRDASAVRVPHARHAIYAAACRAAGVAALPPFVAGGAGASAAAPAAFAHPLSRWLGRLRGRK